MPARFDPRTITQRILANCAEQENGCIIWRGAKSTSGYGKIGHRGSSVYTHRAIYEDSVGPIPPGHCIRHQCDTPLCQNVKHMLTGTHAENTADMIRRGRAPSPESISARSKISAPRGERHPFSKLTNQQVLEIRAAVGRCVDIGERYGIGAMEVSRIKRKQRWAHVPDAVSA